MWTCHRTKEAFAVAVVTVTVAEVASASPPVQVTVDLVVDGLSSATFVGQAPGDRSRSEALAEEGQRSVTIVLGLIVAFGVAGIIEGFITGTSLPTWNRIAIGAVALGAFVLWVVALGPDVIFKIHNKSQFFRVNSILIMYKPGRIG